MVSKKVTVKNSTGLHLRPAGNLCKEAVKYKCRVEFRHREGTANAKSVLSVLGACVKCGDEIEIICTGEDEEEAPPGSCRGGRGRPWRIDRRNEKCPDGGLPEFWQ